MGKIIQVVIYRSVSDEAKLEAYLDEEMVHSKSWKSKFERKGN